MGIKQISLDLETYSSVDLTRSGVYRYSEAADFEILLYAYSVDGGPVKVVDIAKGEKLPEELERAIFDPNVIKRAFNAQFERVCLSRHFGQWLAPDSWRCTMVWSAYLGLPLSLEGAALVTGAEKQKLREGKDLIRYFCQPCNPNKANGGRSRNLPEHALEKWERFKAYNARDVETEMAIQARLAKFPVPDNEWENYILDQQINDRGIKLDMQLVRQAIDCDERSREELTRAMRDLTDMENPNSVSQMKSWLADNGIKTDTLGKAAVKELIPTVPKKLAEVLQLRQDLAKSSVKKYTAMENAVCKDGRARGLIQFYGANRTGRYSGRLIQIQNLPQNHMPDLEQARGLVRSGEFDGLEMLYDSIPGVLSELIRTAFIPKPGFKFIVADFSAIEARVIAWLAGETWKTNVFAGDGKIYEATAARMFHVPIESVTKGSTLRQKAKQTELACIAEGQLVLTHRGLKPIENVTIHDRLWDGEAWISHEGVICKGIREVIEYEGLRATPDHLVWIEGPQEPVRLEIAAACGAHLIQTGNGREAVRLGDCHQPGEKMEQNHESLLCTNSMQRLWTCSVAELKQSKQRKIKGMSEMFSTEVYPAVALGSHSGCQNSGIRETEELADNSSPVRVYDIRNAGRNHRFTVSGKLVHNCGYGGSVGALKAMGALEMGLAEDELRPLVNAWRQANPNIVRLWWDVDMAAKTAVQNRTTVKTHGIRFECRSGMLFIKLPSGRRLAYVKPRIGMNRFGSESVTYEGVGQTKKWERLESYGPKFVENIVQATARDLLTDAMQRIDKAGYYIVMHVHDEVVVEAPTDVSTETICQLMCVSPPWAKGLLLRADGYECGFYKKE